LEKRRGHHVEGVQNSRRDGLRGGLRDDAGVCGIQKGDDDLYALCRCGVVFNRSPCMDLGAGRRHVLGLDLLGINRNVNAVFEPQPDRPVQAAKEAEVRRRTARRDVRGSFDC